MELEGSNSEEDTEGNLKKGGNFRMPINYSTQKWRRLLACIWRGQSKTPERKSLDAKLKGVRVNVDEEWSAFSRCLERTYREAYEEVLALGDALEEEEEAIRAREGRRGAGTKATEEKRRRSASPASR